MEIYWLGHGCFRLRGREATVVTDPCAPSTGYKIGKVAADVVTVSHDAPESNHTQAITGDAKFLTGPGEYEIANVLMTGVRTNRGAGSASNVAFVIDIDDVRICHLGSLAQVPHADDAEELSSADVLLLPVGGGEVLDAAKAAETVSLLEAKLVIPMIYKTDASTAELESVDRFLKELGAEAKAAEQRLNVTKSTVPSSTTIAFLNYRGS